MRERSTSVKLFGQHAAMRYSEKWFGYAVLVMRLTIGWVFFYSGITKLIDPDWSAEEFLLTTASVQANPFAPFWEALARDWLWLVDPLNEWGLTLIGLSFFLGVVVRVGAFFGVVLMGLYYAANLPLEWGFIIDFHIVYAMLMFGLAAVGAGRILGLDYYIEQNVPLPYPWSRYLLG